MLEHLGVVEPWLLILLLPCFVFSSDPQPESLLFCCLGCLFQFGTCDPKEFQAPQDPCVTWTPAVPLGRWKLSTLLASMLLPTPHISPFFLWKATINHHSLFPQDSRLDHDDSLCFCRSGYAHPAVGRLWWVLVGISYHLRLNSVTGFKHETPHLYTKFSQFFFYYQNFLWLMKSL